jgi:hypothetical protein
LAGLGGLDFFHLGDEPVFASIFRLIGALVRAEGFFDLLSECRAVDELSANVNALVIHPVQGALALVFVQFALIECSFDFRRQCRIEWRICPGFAPVKSDAGS